MNDQELLQTAKAAAIAGGAKIPLKQS